MKIGGLFVRGVTGRNTRTPVRVHSNSRIGRKLAEISTNCIDLTSDLDIIVINLARIR